MGRERYSKQAPTDPFGAFNFRLELGGNIEAGFSELVGLDSQTEIIEYRNSNDEITPRKLPGLRKFSNITLKRGMTASLTLWEWRMKVMTGKLERRDISVVIYDDSNTAEVARFNLRNAWPCKWVGPALNAVENGVTVETLELAHEGIEEFVSK